MRTLYAFLIALLLGMVGIILRRIKNCKEKNLQFDGYDAAACLGYGLGLALALGIVFMIFSSSVAIVYEKDGSWQHEQNSYFLYFSYNKDGISVSTPAKIAGYSVYNASEKTLIMHPVIYGSPRKAESKIPFSISPDEYVRVPESPYYFREPPQRVRANSNLSGVVRWVLLEEGQEID